MLLTSGKKMLAARCFLFSVAAPDSGLGPILIFHVLVWGQFYTSCKTGYIEDPLGSDFILRLTFRALQMLFYIHLKLFYIHDTGG